MLEKQYDYEVPQFMCWWEDTIGLYTEEELYNQYKDTNLYDTEEQIGWGAWSQFLNKSIELDTFQEVLAFLKENEDCKLNTQFISHNMHIVRVL
jgi:hypothetical protein